MTIHKEGYTILGITTAILIALNGIIYYFMPQQDVLLLFIGFLSLVFFLIILQFFRSPSRNLTLNENYVIAPADGKVVVIEETVEKEFYKEKRLQVSIFMSPVNVHVNRYPLSGNISYLRYHEGKKLVAWHPKASTENERTSIVIERENKVSVLVRQIAGALAKRIVYYPRENDKVRQGAELGFIKFGSRVDLYLPLTAKVKVHLGQKTKGGVTIIAEL